MSVHETGETPEPSESQFGLRVFFVLAIAVALPFSVGVLLGSPEAMALVVFGELVAGCYYRPTQIVVIPLFVLLMLLLLSLPFCSTARPPNPSQQSRDNLKQIMLAFYAYHDAYDCFPPVYVADELGKPMHSWRVLILPYLQLQALYDQYRFDEPWNGPNNSRLSGEVPSVYRCPSEEDRSSANTSYVFVAGKGTPWADGVAPNIDDITRARGTSNTVAVVEAVDSGIHWMEPTDWTPNQALQRTGRVSGRQYTEDRSPALNAAFADGSVRDIPLDEFRKLLTQE